MIDTTLLDRLARRATELGFGEAARRSLRETFPELRLSFCLEDELGCVTPYREYAGFNLYLVGGEHCLTLTDQLEAAAGVLLAELE